MTRDFQVLSEYSLEELQFLDKFFTNELQGLQIKQNLDPNFLRICSIGRIWVDVLLDLRDAIRDQIILKKEN